MSRSLPDGWMVLVVDHSAAIEEFADAARRAIHHGWMEPVAPGKWTPAEITSHLAESYQVLRGELGGGPGMQLRLSRFKRWLLRRTILPRILATGQFPAGARAPKETRPRATQHEAGPALEILRTQSDAFVKELSDRARSGRARLTHAYFGPMTARQTLRMVAVHARHHARQLASTAASRVDPMV